MATPEKAPELDMPQCGCSKSSVRPDYVIFWCPGAPANLLGRNQDFFILKTVQTKAVMGGTSSHDGVYAWQTKFCSLNSH